jgi:hypothetical protein
MKIDYTVPADLYQNFGDKHVFSGTLAECIRRAMKIRERTQYHIIVGEAAGLGQTRLSAFEIEALACRL